MNNISDVEELLTASAFNDGIKLGAQIRDELAERILDGTLKIPSDGIFNVEVTIGNFFQYELPMSQKILAKLGSPAVTSLGNTGFAVGGGAIFLISGKNLLTAKNKPAKIFYGLSMMCSGTGSASSIFAIYANKCGLDKTGMIGDGFGWLFMKAGNYMNKIGETLDGKRQPQGFGINRFLPRSRVRKPPKLGAGYKGLSFVPHSGSLNLNTLSEIPYAEIIAVGGTVYTVYRCTKLLIKGYGWMFRYMKKKSTPDYNPRHLVWFMSEYLIESFSFDRIYKIYYVALAL